MTQRTVMASLDSIAASDPCDGQRRAIALCSVGGVEPLGKSRYPVQRQSCRLSISLVGVDGGVDRVSPRLALRA